MSSGNLFGGTPKKTLDLIKYMKCKTVIYFWGDQYGGNFIYFLEAGASVYVGTFGRNIFRHLRLLLEIVDRNNVDVVQTQFPFGEILGFMIKLCRPRIKIIVAFVNAQNPSVIRKYIANQIYRKVDAFVFVSEFVKGAKLSSFPHLSKTRNEVIYNGTAQRIDNGTAVKIFNHIALLDVTGLIDIKNIDVLVDAMALLVNKYGMKDIYLYIVGDGPKKTFLSERIVSNKLSNNILLLGYQANVGMLIDQCDIFVHPCYEEGFGIAVAEAMAAGKPIIVANAGALPELIENGKSGMVVDPFDAIGWADAIANLVQDEDLRVMLARNAKNRANCNFSLEKFADSYYKLYTSILQWAQ